MKRLSILNSIILAFAAVSCEKAPVAVPAEENTATINKSFTVTTDDTKTSLDGVNIVWDATDVITVKAATTGNEYDFSFESGSGSSAVFSGAINEADANETVFYAIYPNYKKNEISGNVVKVSEAALGHTVKAVKDGFDPQFAVMAAKSENGAAFNFKHGMAYFKLEINQTGITNVRITVTGNGRIYGRPNVDVTNSENSAQDKGSSSSNYIDMQPESGTIEEGISGTIEEGIYYIPVTVKASSLGDITVAYTKDDKTSQLTTSAKSSVKMKAGKIYDLGCPPITFDPTIVCSDPDALDYDAESGSFTFKVNNATDATPSVNITSGSWITGTPTISGPDSEGNYTVSFDCTKNNATDAVFRSAIITISYSGATDKDVTISQKTNTTEVYTWNFTSLITTTGDLTEGDTYTFLSGTKEISYIAGKGDKTATSSSLTYVQPNGAGSTTNRCFSFTVLSGGILTITGCSNKDAEKVLHVFFGSEEVAATSGGTSSNATPSEHTYSIAGAGTITIYATGGPFRYYEIAYNK